MLRQFFVISICFFLFSGVDAFSGEERDIVKGPIVVTSDTLTADNKAHTALFEHNVVAKTADMTLYADRMLVYYEGDGGEVTRIEATNNVKLHKDSRIITAREATYYAVEEKIVFTGEPRALDGNNVVTGSKMIFFIKDERSFVENSKVFLKSTGDR